MKQLAVHILFLLAALSASAQGSFIDYTRQTNMAFPLSNLSMVDGRLGFYGAGMWMYASVMDKRIVAVEPDSMSVVHAPGANYMVQHPLTGSVYYTTEEHDGLMEFKRKRKKVECNPVPFSAEGSLNMVHPVFSSDGTFLVFSTDKRIGFGGFDLWYYHLKRGKWEGPYNMGDRINTAGNEINPTIVGDYLVFSSNGRSGRIDYDFYATRLVALSNSDDSVVSMIPIGRAAVQSLPPFVNDNDNQLYLTFDTLSNVGYWVTETRDSNSLFYLFEGDLRGVMLKGVVSSAVGGNPIAGAVVRVLADGSHRVADSIVTDRTGGYSFYLPSSGTFKLQVSAPDYFNDTTIVFTRRDNEEKMISSQVHDVQLSRLELNTMLFFSDVFTPGVGVELHPDIDNSLRQLTEFLQANPHIEAHITVTSDLSDNADFNIMLTNKRVAELSGYLKGKLPGNVVHLNNGDAMRQEKPMGSGNTVVAVQLFKLSQSSNF